MFKFTWKKFLLTLVLAAVGSLVGFLLFLSASCVIGSGACGPGSGVKMFLAWAANLPLFAIRKIFGRENDSYGWNAIDLSGWALMFIYYYLIVSVVGCLLGPKKTIHV